MNKDLLERIKNSYYGTYRDDSLIFEVEALVKLDREKYDNLLKKYNEASDAKTKNAIVALAKPIAEEINFLNGFLAKERAKASKKELDSTGAVVSNNAESEQAENRSGAGLFITGAVIGSLLLGLGCFAVKGCKDTYVQSPEPSAIVSTVTPEISATPEIVVTPEATATPEVTATPEIEVVKNHYVNSTLTDASDDEQVYERAQEIYDTYCVPYLTAMSESDRAQAMLKCNVDSIANIIRHKNGLLTLNNKGEAEYGPNSIDDMVALQNSIFAQYPSIQKFGSQIFFIPLSTVFIDGSQEQLNQIQLDEKMEEVVKARRSEDFDSFIAKSQEWCYEYIEQFDRDNFNGQNNIYDINSMKYTFYIANDEQYICNIFEVIKGNKTSLCIDYCTEDGEVVKTPFVQVLDKVRNGQTDFVSLSAGTEEENKKKRTTLPVQWYTIESEYFEELCDQYVNNGGTLKLK